MCSQQKKIKNLEIKNYFKVKGCQLPSLCGSIPHKSSLCSLDIAVRFLVFILGHVVAFFKLLSHFRFNFNLLDFRGFIFSNLVLLITGLLVKLILFHVFFRLLAYKLGFVQEVTEKVDTQDNTANNESVEHVVIKFGKSFLVENKGSVDSFRGSALIVNKVFKIFLGRLQFVSTNACCDHHSNNYEIREASPEPSHPGLLSLALEGKVQLVKVAEHDQDSSSDGKTKLNVLELVNTTGSSDIRNSLSAGDLEIKVVFLEDVISIVRTTCSFLIIATKIIKIFSINSIVREDLSFSQTPAHRNPTSSKGLVAATA